MSNGMSELDKERLRFFSQSIFERRKTQYILALFLLAATGACASLVIQADEPLTVLLVLLVPILLEIPIYLSWCYQNHQILAADRDRRDLLENNYGVHERRWQEPLARYAFDVVMIALPFLIVALAWSLVRKEYDCAWCSNTEFPIIALCAMFGTIFSLVSCVIYNREPKTKE